MDVLTVEAFQLIKRYILMLGGRRTYCAMYNLNPHHRFDWFDAYLTPDVGQRNIMCDPELSDFDELVVQDWGLDKIYVSARCEGDALTYDFADESTLRRYFEAMYAEAREAM
ncbi:MAG TPA: hypothetical protein VL463_20665 [Kofleriaceae bacterium]|jgi:hypothetical protein|nr:hypothetical protein [Kofleriaceae bacterium]